MFPEWAKYYKLVDKGFDGLSTDQIASLKPNNIELNLLKKYKAKEALASIIFLLILAIEFFVVIKIGLPIYHPITIIITVIITVAWYVIQDNYRVETHRIESGYYKKGFSYICQNCKTEFKMEFKDINKYNTIEKNKNGIRTVNCPNCNSPILLYNFDIIFKDYQNHMNKVNK